MTDPKEAVKAALTPETFNFVEAIVDRDYPEIDVPVYLNEKAAQRFVAAATERSALMQEVAKLPNPGVEAAERLEALEVAAEAAAKEVKESEYVITLRGISPEAGIQIEESTYELFPKEFEEATSPITGQVTKTEIPNDERDDEFATLIRQAHIVSVKSPSGAVDADWSDKEKVRAMYAALPLISRAKLDDAIGECTIQVDFYRELAHEVF